MPLIRKPRKCFSSLQKMPPVIFWTVFTAAICFFIISVSVENAEAQSLAQEQTVPQYKSLIQTVFDFIQQNYVEEVDPKALYEGAMSGMFNALGDPYSAFLKEKDMTDLDQNVIKGNYGGIGLYISKPSTYVEIASPIDDSPGWKAGLQPGDLIIKIGEESTADLTLDEVLARLKGPAGDKVFLTIRRGDNLEFPVTLTRAIIEVPTVKQAMIGDIGYLRLISFSNMTAERARQALDSFKANGYKALILDLRNNYGGLLSTAVSVCNLFIKDGTVVSVKSRIAKQNSVYNAGNNPVVPEDIPIVVLINHGSASASEIVAGALKDHGRAYLIGEKSFGKGSVQQVYPLKKSGFKITTARYYTPSDVNIDKIGIPPDREVLFPKFSNEDAEKLNKLIASNAIPKFVQNNKKAAPGVVDGFARQLQDEYGLDFSLLRRLIRDEENRTVIAPVYDLEYDVQLQEAVKILREGVYYQLIQNTKTLRDLQEESADDEAQPS
ncbi:MAG: S41 family peptidase [Spirochaetaceae bacterium]|jgi:carboxyl-terminal processing protease|nr:S41 family peptidase [Spirochaetaceae bacterium]